VSFCLKNTSLFVVELSDGLGVEYNEPTAIYGPRVMCVDSMFQVCRDLIDCVFRI